jgi:CHAT domain-containing protein
VKEIIPNIRILVLTAVLSLSAAGISSAGSSSVNNYVHVSSQSDTLIKYINRFRTLLANPQSPDCAQMYSTLSATYSNISREGSDTFTLAKLSDIARYCGYYDFVSGEYEESRKFYMDVLDIERLKGDTISDNFLVALSQIGLSYFNEKRFSESIGPLHNSIIIRERLEGENSSGLVRSLIILSSAYVEFPALDQAESAARRGIDLIFATGSQNNQLCKLYYTLGRVYKEKGDYNTAKSYLMEARTSFFNYQSDPEVLLLINNFNAVIAKLLNDTTAALDSYRDAIEFIETYNYAGSTVPAVYSNYGFYLAELGRLDEAESMFLDAIACSENNFGAYSSSNLRERENYADFLFDSRKNYSKAEAIYSDLFSRIESVNDIESLTYVCQGYAEVKSYEKDFEAALDLYYMVDKRQDEMSPLDRAYYLQGRGEVFLDYYLHSDSLSLLSDALRDFDLAMNIIDSSKLDLNVEASRLNLTGRFDFFSDKAIRSAILLYNKTLDRSYLDKAFSYSEKSRASTLLAATRESRAMKFNIPDSLLFNERVLSSKIKELDARIFTEKGRERVNTGVLTELESSRLDVFTERERLVDHFEREYPDYYRLKHNTRVAQPQEIVKHIGRKMNFIEYYTTDSTIYIFVINRDGSHIESVEIDSSYNNIIRQFRSDLVNPVFENGVRDQFSRIVSSAYYLYSKLIKPVEAYLVSDKLLIAGDELLAYIPFEALVTDTAGISAVNYRNLAFLFRDYDIEYTYSATLLLENPGKGKSIYNNALVFAPGYGGGLSSDSIMISRQTEREELKDIQGAKEEAIYISELLGGDLYIDTDATEANFIRKCSKPAVIHLAMHTLMNDMEPMFSRMVFSLNDSVEDGLLNTYEVYDLELDAKMVVLSSCNTGTGYLSKGEGVISLARSFMFAGAPTVVMSLWEVDDQSGTDIIKTFYKHLKQGRSKSESLRKARKKYLANAGQMHSHPYFWCSLVILGEDEAIFFKLNRVFIISGIILLVIGGIFYRKLYPS